MLITLTRAPARALLHLHPAALRDDPLFRRRLLLCLRSPLRCLLSAASSPPPPSSGAARRPAAAARSPMAGSRPPSLARGKLARERRRPRRAAADVAVRRATAPDGDARHQRRSSRQRRSITAVGAGAAADVVHVDAVVGAGRQVEEVAAPVPVDAGIEVDAAGEILNRLVVLGLSALTDATGPGSSCAGPTTPHIAVARSRAGPTLASSTRRCLNTRVDRQGSRVPSVETPTAAAPSLRRSRHPSGSSRRTARYPHSACRRRRVRPASRP